MLSPALAPLLRRAAMSVTGHVDVASVRIGLAVSRSKRQRLRDLEDRLPYYEDMARRYAAVDPAEFYAAPFVPSTVTSRRVLGWSKVDVRDVAWPSEYVPHLPDYRAAYRAFPSNGTVHVRHFRVRPDAPTLVLVHGYRSGDFFVEQRAWPLRDFLARGLNVALFTLPFHGRRTPDRIARAPIFPSQGNLSRTNEGFGQAIFDLRSLLRWLRAEGSPKVGAVGMSLGGYVAALLATVEPTLDFTALYIPLADFTNAVVNHDRLRGIEPDRRLVEVSREALAIHSPLTRAPAIAGEKVLVLGAEGDRITGPWHAQALATHFGARASTFAGGHLLQLARGRAFGELMTFLETLGVIDDPSRATLAFNP